MNVTAVSRRIDAVMRFFLYVLIAWLPYSNAAVEICVVASVVLWFFKRGLLFMNAGRGGQLSLKTFLTILRPVPTRLDMPIFVFLLICLVSSLFSRQPLETLADFMTKTLEWFVVFYLAAEVMTHKNHIRIALGLLILTSVVTALDSFIQYYLTGHDILRGRMLTRQGASAAFNHANSLGIYMAMAIPIVGAALTTVRRIGLRVLGGFVLGLLFWSLSITFSRGAWLAAGAGLIVLLFFRHPRFAFYLFSGLIITLLLIFILCPDDMLLPLRLNKESLVSTFSWRWGLWEDSLKMIRARPWLGHGINTFMEYFQDYRRKAFEGPMMERFFTPQPYAPTYAHNSYIQLTAELGWLGLASFLWIIFRFVRNSVTMLLSSNHQPMQFLLAGIFSGLVAFLLHCFIDTDLYSLRLAVYFWLWFGISASLARMNWPSNNLSSQTVFERNVMRHEE